MAENKTISVVMCTCNGRNRHLAEQLDSIFAQTLLPTEIVVQDDCSTDDTLDLLEEYAQKAPTGMAFRIFRNETRRGINANFFSAMAKATGDYIAISDQDDIWMPEKLEHQLHAIGENMMCACRSVPFADGGEDLPFDRRRPSCNLIRLFYSSIAGHCQMFRRTLLDFTPSETLCPEIYSHTLYDVILSTTAAAFDSIVLLDEVLVRQRRYAEAATFLEHDSKRERQAGNALGMVMYGLRNYRRIKPLMAQVFNVKLNFLRHINANTDIYKDGLRLLECESSCGLRAQLGVVRLYVRYRHTLFYTYEKDPVALVRALLHPLMQVYIYRYLADKK
jgi:glycosyltransferase involved in cell wall biosynthesis